MFEKNSFLATSRRYLLPLLLLVAAIPATADPLWWSQPWPDGGPKVIDATVTNADPKGVANIGQAKYMAKRALEAMRLVMPETADSIEAQLVGAGKIIPTWVPPAAGSTLAKEQFAPLLIGQLKAIADPFYTALRDADSEWVLAQLAENGTMDLANPDNFFPWTSDGADNADKAIATIGQLKAVFSLRFESIPLTLTAEDVGTPDEDLDPDVISGDVQYIPPPGAQSAPAAPSSTSLPYEIQFRKGTKFQKKFGYAPWAANPYNISTRYLTKYQSTGAAAGDVNRTRLSGSDWQIGYTRQTTAQRVIWFTAADHSRKNSYNILSGEENIGAGYLPYQSRYTDWNVETWRGKWCLDNTPYSYDFPPYDLNWDAPARIFYEEWLADENTMEMVKQTALDNPPAYPGPGDWKNGKPYATWDVSDDNLGVTYSRFIFRFKKRNANTDSPPVSAGVYFMPKGGSAQQLLKTVSWNGKIAKSADCIVDPKALRRGLEGDFHIGFSSIRFELDVAKQDQREVGKTVIIPANDTDSGGGNAPDKATPVVRFPGMDDSWYTGATITLTKVSGVGDVRFKVGTTEIPLSTNLALNNLAPNFFKSGGAYTGGNWKIEGVTAGPVKMTLTYTKGTTTMSATRTATVIRGDMDVDSDNSGTIASTDEGKIAEENIENDPTLPGKVIAASSDFLNDPDGVPNSVDGLAELRINASGFKSSDLIKFGYDGSNPAGTQSSTTDGVTTYQNAAGALRIWKKPTGGGPPVLSGYVAQDTSYSMANLGLVPNTEQWFYVQGVSPSPIKTTIKVEMSSNGVFVEDTLFVNVRPYGVTSDHNRDGTINDLDLCQPIHFLLNDDDDVHAPNVFQRTDYTTPNVDGVKDLEDFFPVFLDIQQLVISLPPSASIKYKLRQVDGAVNFLETNLTRETAFAYQGGTLTNGFGTSLAEPASSATTTQVTAAGVELSTQFLNNIKDHNQGVILVEGRTPTSAPLVLSVEENGVQRMELPLSLHLGERILLLLHGMNSNTAAWDPFVTYAFGAPTTHATNIRDGEIQGPAPLVNPGGVRCYRIQFGASEDKWTARTGLENLTADKAKGGINGLFKDYLTEPTLKCGDFETFAELAQEVDDGIALLLDRHPNAEIVMLGHSRGGLIGRKFLQGSSPRRSAVSAFLITSSPQKGSPIGRIYEYLNIPANQRPLSGSSNNDWQTVDWLCEPTALGFVNKDTVDVRRPVIDDMSDRSAAIAELNDPAQVANLPAKIMYGEIIYCKVDLGAMKLGFGGIVDYKIFDDDTWDGWDQVSTAAETFLLGAGKTPSDFPGDGLVPFNHQVFTTLPGFPAPGFPPAPAPATGQNTIPRLQVTSEDVVHTDAPRRFQDIISRLRLITPNWFP